MARRRLRQLLWPVLVLVLLGVAGPAEARTVRDGFFGMHVPDPVTADASADIGYGSLGLMTAGVYWPSLEPAPGEWDFTRLTALVEAAEARGARPMLVLGRTPAHLGAPASVPPMTDWKRYVTEVVTRFGSRVDYSVWPEPNVKQNWIGTPRQLARLAHAAATIIHGHAADATVTGPALVLRLKGQRRWFRAFYESRFDGRGVGSYLDAVALDPYPAVDGTPEDSLAHILWARRTLAGLGVRKPIWNAEINYGVVGAGQTSPTMATATQTAYVSRTFLLNAEAGVKKVFWLGWDRYDTMGIDLVTADGEPTRAAAAYVAVRSWMVGQRFRGCDVERRTWTCTIVSGDDVRRVYWRTKGEQRMTLPRSTKVVQDVLGATLRVGSRITVTRRPVMVLSRR